MLDNNQNAILKKDSVTISNGIVWTKDKTTMYYIDTPTSEIKAYDYNDATGAISNERVAVKVSDTLGYPDGMTIDETITFGLVYGMEVLLGALTLKLVI